MGVNNRNRDKGARLGADHAALPIARKIASSHITAKAAPLDRCRCFFARADAVYAFRTQGFSSMESALSYRQGNIARFKNDIFQSLELYANKRLWFSESISSGKLSIQPLLIRPSLSVTKIWVHSARQSQAGTMHRIIKKLLLRDDHGKGSCDIIVLASQILSLFRPARCLSDRGLV
jgi:hypothetical protein